MFTHAKSIRIGDILDGTSNTFAIGEAAGGKPICVGIGCKTRHPAYGAETPWFMNFNPFNWFDQGFVFSGIHCSTVEPLNKGPVTDSLLAGPGAKIFDCRPSYRGGPHRVSNVRSFHRGGAFFLMAGGSVHFIKNSIDMPTYRALSTIQGGDIGVLD